MAHTNKAPVSSVRGAGYPQAAFAMERLLDALARELKLDRAELRRRNLIPAEKMPYLKPLKTRSGRAVAIRQRRFSALQAEILRAMRLGRFPAPPGCGARPEGRYLGIGLAHGVKGTGRGPFEFGGVRVSPTGKHLGLYRRRGDGAGARHGARANLRRATSACRAEDVTVVAGDTAAAPLGLGGFASRQTVTAGSSVHVAAQARRRQGAQARRHVLEAGRRGSGNRRRRGPRRRRSAACR